MEYSVSPRWTVYWPGPATVRVAAAGRPRRALCSCTSLPLQADSSAASVINTPRRCHGFMATAYSTATSTATDQEPSRAQHQDGQRHIGQLMGVAQHQGHAGLAEVVADADQHRAPQRGTGA